MNAFNAADWTVILLYLAGIIVFGSWFGRGQKTTRDYFLGSKDVSWWGVGLSIVATETSALTFIGIPALAYAEDWSFLQIVLGYVIARLVLAVVLVPQYFRGEMYSPYQLLTRRLGPSAGRLAGAFFLLSGTLAAGVRVYVTCIPLQLMLGIQILPAILLFVGLSWIYTYLGGIKAVVWTDVVQFVLFMAGGLYAILFIPTLVDGGFSGAMARAGAAGKLHWLNLGFTGALPFNLWMGLLGGTVQVMASHGADQLIVQRVLTCRNVTEGRKALLLSAAIILPLFVVFLLAGTMLWVYYQQYPLAIALPANQAGFAQRDYLFPIFILTVVPHVFKGFLIVAILSAAMSSVSSALSALASVSTMEFCQGWLGQNRDDAARLRFSQRATLFWAVLLVLVAYASREATLVLNWAFSLSGLTSGAMLGGLLWSLRGRSGGSLPVIVGMSVSLAVMLALQVCAGKRVAWPWYTLIGTFTTVLAAAGTHWLTADNSPAGPADRQVESSAPPVA